MVAKVVSGKSIRGVLNYNENKVATAQAQLLMACGFPRHPDQLSFKNKLERFELLTSQNERTKTNSMHIMLNFSRHDTVDDQQLKQIAIDYMKRIGFGQQPFLVYRHFDTCNPHIHIATVNIADGGERIETHNIGKNQSEKARREIELSYRLIKAEDQQKEMAHMLRPAELKKAVYGKAETKATISSIVREVVSSYRFTSLPELNGVLRQFNVMAFPGAEGTAMRKNGGLVYHLLGADGEAAGVPIKASSIYSSPTLKNLEKKFSSNKDSRRPYGLRLKHLLDKSLRECRSREDLEQRLHAQGIRIVMRANVKGNVYGITFIDNATRVVFNGGDLGKAYAATAFMERLHRMEALSIQKAFQGGTSSGSEEKTVPVTSVSYPASEHPVMEKIFDILTSDRHQEGAPDPYRRRRKKKRQQVEQI